LNRIDLYKKVIDNCDDALKESFINRMNIAEHIAKYKTDNGQEINTDEHDEEKVQRVTFNVPQELKPMADALWRSLARMNRSRQYAYCIRHDKYNSVSYDEFLTNEMPKGIIACESDIEAEVADVFKAKTEALKSADEVIESLTEGKSVLGAVKTKGFYDAAGLYSTILEKSIFINSFVLTKSGDMIVLLSGKIVRDPENTIITAAFSIKMNKCGDIAQKVSIFAEAGMSIEYLSVKTQDIELDDKKNINIVYCELSGGDFNSPRTRAAFMQLERECSFFRILGYRKSV